MYVQCEVKQELLSMKFATDRHYLTIKTPAVASCFYKIIAAEDEFITMNLVTFFHSFETDSANYARLPDTS